MRCRFFAALEITGVCVYLIESKGLKREMIHYWFVAKSVKSVI